MEGNEDHGATPWTLGTRKENKKTNTNTMRMRENFFLSNQINDEKEKKKGVGFSFQSQPPRKGRTEIKDTLKSQFDDITAKDLTLWRMPISILPKKERRAISQADIPSDMKEELDGSDDISDVFEGTPPKKTIYIIVQRPPHHGTHIQPCQPTNHPSRLLIRHLSLSPA